MGNDRPASPWVIRVHLLLTLGALLWLAGPIALAGGIAVLLVVPGLEWLAGRLSDEARMSVGRVARVMAPPIGALAAAIMIKEWPAISAGRPVGAAGLAALVVLATGSSCWARTRRRSRPGSRDGDAPGRRPRSSGIWPAA